MAQLALVVVSALLGALASGGSQILMDFHRRKLERQSTLVAVVSEIDAICRLIGHQRYLEAVDEALASNASGEWDGKSLVVDIRADYFSVVNGLGPRLADLKPEHVRDVVRFYAYAKSAIDSLRPDGPHAEPERDNPEELIANLQSVQALLRAMLRLGEKIRGFPEEPIARNFAAWPGAEVKPTQL